MLLAALDHASRGGANGGPRILFPLFFLLLIGFLVSRVVRHKRGGGHNHHHRGSSMATLRDRFARGEIDREEYDHRLAVLNGDDMIPPAPAAPAAPVTGWSAPTPPAPPQPDYSAKDTAAEVIDDSTVDDSVNEEEDE